MTTDVIYVGDCLLMNEVIDKSVALTVTSPPYWDAIDYKVHAQQPGEWYRDRTPSGRTYEEYLAWLKQVYKKIWEKTRPGGFCATVIGTILVQGKHYPLPFHFVHVLEAAGWTFHQDIVWHKVAAGIKRAGTFIMYRKAGYYYPNIMTEYIIVAHKPGGDYLYKTSTNKRIKLNDIITKEVANNVWHIPPIPPRQINHPCPFPEEIPLRLIMLYSNPGDIVLDPFAGSGQTLKVAKHLGRRFVGYDIEPQYVEYARSRLDEPLNLRQHRLLLDVVKTESMVEYEQEENRPVQGKPENEG